MAKDAVLTVRVPTKTRKRLDRLAKATARSRSYLAAEAIDSYLSDQEWQLARIDAGIKALDEGRSVPHEQVAEWLRSWGKPNEKKPPKCD